MRTAVFADMHGNCIGLDAVLADLRRDSPDQIVCLGDVAQGGPQPAETVDRVRELGCPVVMGNSDAWLLSDKASESISDRMREVREWTIAQLSGEDLKFLESFEPTVELDVGAGRRLLCFHGSPGSFDDVILPETPEEEFQKMVGEYGSFVLTGGHTHLQQVRRLGESFFFNPGSAGLAYNRHQEPESFHFDPWAEYAVLTSDEDRLGLEFRRVPFDSGEIVRDTLESGMPYAESTAARYGHGGSQALHP